MSNRINAKLSKYAAKLISSYLEFPDNQPITALDFRCGTGLFLDTLTKKHNDQRFLFGVNQYDYEAEMALSDHNFYKVSRAFYKEEGKITKDAFSLVVVDPYYKDSLIQEMFQTVDPFTEPDFEKEEKDRLFAAKQHTDQNQIDLGTEDLSEEEKKKLEEDLKKKLEKAIKEKRLAFRRALREQERRISGLRDDSFLLARATDKLMPNGILVMIIPKELIDQSITIRLANQYDNIKILRLDDDEYLDHRKCVIIARKRPKKVNNRSQGILLAETKLTPYKEIEMLDLQEKPLYKVPSQPVEAVEMFRVGPITPSEALEHLKKSSLLKNYQNTYSQTMINENPKTPTALHKGHIMLLLTSGFLDGFIGKGPNQHLVKGTAVKMVKETVEENEDGSNSYKEREYYHIVVKILNRNGEFKRLM